MAACKIYGLQPVLAPQKEPVSLTEMKRFLRLDDAYTVEDDTINALIKAGRERCEELTYLALISQQWTMTLDRFPYGSSQVIEIPKSPLIWDTSTTSPHTTADNIKYLDITDGTLTTIDPANYQVDTTTQPPTIRSAYLGIWPTSRVVPNGVQVTFTAGYGSDRTDVPSEIRERIKNYVAYCFEHRAERDEAFLDSLFQRFSVGTY